MFLRFGNDSVSSLRVFSCGVIVELLLAVLHDVSNFPHETLCETDQMRGEQRASATAAAAADTNEVKSVENRRVPKRIERDMVSFLCYV